MPGTTAHALRRNWASLAFAAVVLPLAILLVLQFRVLTRLQETSAAAHRLALKGYARTVLRTAEAYYRRKAADALSIPTEWLDVGHAGALAAHFAARDGAGVKRYFVIPFGAPTVPRFFAPDGRAVDGGETALTRAALIAAASWREAAQQGAEVHSTEPVVDERDADNRVVLRPILDGTAHLGGVAGMILDQAYFRDRYLPDLLRAEQGLIPEPLREHVTTGIGRRSPDAPALPPGNDIDVPFRFVFTDATLQVRSPSLTPEQWERRGFLVNLTLSLLLGTVVLAAVVVALRSALRATQLSQMKTDFVSAVSHELRTPLASIRVFGELLRLGRVSEPDKVRQYGEYIEAESGRLTQLVNNILDFSKIESGQKRFQFERADLAAIVAETLESFELRLAQDGFALEVEKPPAPLPPVWVDRPALGQVLANLLDNAIKYSGGARRIGVALGQENGFVTVAVSDRGSGIESEEQERIFEKFYRVGNGLVHEAKGSGLGLAIVKHIVEAHRGRVRVESRPGAGSTFTIELPAHAG